MPAMSQFLHLTDLDGNSTSIAKSAVFGVEASSYEVTYTVEDIEPPEEPPEAEDASEPKRSLPIRALRGTFRVAALILGEIFREEPKPPEKKTIEYPCSIVHVRMGNKTRRIWVKETHDEVIGALQ